jgi:uncharacterized protein (TIGR00251 family)
VRVTVRVTPRANRDEVVPGDPLRVRVTAAPVDGKANAAVCKLLAAHYGVRKSAVRVVSGETSRTKVVEIDG